MNTGTISISYGWWSEHHPRCFFEELTRRAPLLFLHNLLAGLEGRILRRLIAYYGEEYARTLWETSTDEEADPEIRKAVDRTLLANWCDLFAHVTQRDAHELAALRAEFRQSEDPAIAKVIAEAIAIERSLP